MIDYLQGLSQSCNFHPPLNTAKTDRFSNCRGNAIAAGPYAGGGGVVPESQEDGRLEDQRLEPKQSPN